ncbi:MFS transporter [Roseivivax isoporae]|uniref:MFS transporter n=1 Tax=Roseivivax isoporae LMG 25204 TaxID=1449351 RepID=X7F9S8_9RHOB|nr:MFS transporter [Roseivivax isoporae]ETX29652.1 MFS transporter [Roseivivax isoporae LMG 25204]
MSDAHPFDGAYAWTRLAATLLIAVVGNVGMWTYVTVLPEVAAEFGAGRGTASLGFTATMLGFAAGNLVIGRWVDRFGITRVLAAMGLWLGLAFFVAARAPTIEVLLAAQLAIGFGTATSFGPLIADVSQWFERRRGVAVAIAASGNYLSGTVWSQALAHFPETADWRWGYGLLAWVLVLALPPLALALRRRVSAAAMGHAERQAGLRAGRTGFSPRQLQWMLGAAGIGCCVAMSMPQVHIVALCVDLGYGPAAGTEMLTLMLLGGVASRLVSGWLADLLGGVRTLLLGSVLQALALALYIPAGSLPSLYVVSLVFGLAQGGIVPSYAVIVREYLPAREAGARVGFVIMMTILGMALGGWMSGAVYEATGSYALAFWNGILWNGLNIAIMLAILLRGRRQSGTGALPA